MTHGCDASFWSALPLLATLAGCVSGAPTELVERPSATAPAPALGEARAPAVGEAIATLAGERFALPTGAVGSRPTVLIFIGHDCPISNGYAPEIGRLARHYQPLGVAFAVVYAERELSAAIARTHAVEFGYPCPALLDSELRLAKRFGARRVPEAVLLTAEGRRAYHGRIDDRYYDFGRQRAAPTRTELRDALDAILAGRSVAVPHAPALGCDIDLAASPEGQP